MNPPNHAVQASCHQIQKNGDPMIMTKSTALMGALLLLNSAGAVAQLAFHDPATNMGVLDQVVSEFSTRALAWQTVVSNAASWLFWTLGTISFTWTMGMLAVRKADLGEFFVEFIRFILFFGFFYWLLKNGPNFSDSIIRSLRQLGDSAAGTTGLSPSGIVDVGFMIWKQAIKNLSVWSPVDSFIGIVLCAGILILLAVIAVNMLLLLVSAWILMYAGIFFLGFGGSRWTSDMAINYFKTVFGVAVQIFTMILLVGIGDDILMAFYGKMTKGSLNFEELGVMLVFCLTLLLLVSKIPPLLASVITGGGVGSAAAIGNFTAGATVGAAIGAAGAASAAASMAGAAITAGAAGMAGGAQALMAAVSKASALEGVVAGTGDLMPAMQGAGANERIGGSSSPLAEAMGGGSSRPSQNTGISGIGDNLGDSNGNSGRQSKDGREGGSTAESSPFRTDEKNGEQTKSKPTGTLAGVSKIAAKVGRAGVGAASNLAQGSLDVGKATFGRMTDAALSRIGETIGGKIAAAITARNEESQPSSSTTSSFDGNSLSAGKPEPVDAEAEVAAFRDKGLPQSTPDMP
jgi:type IV secretion system protein TrbL